MTIEELIGTLEKYPKKHAVRFASQLREWSIISDYEGDEKDTVWLDLDPVNGGEADA